MKKILALALLLGSGLQLSAGYAESTGALKTAGDIKVAGKKLDALLAQPGTALAKDADAAALLADNQKALELFRQAAQVHNDGFLFAAKEERPGMQTPLPNFTSHYMLFRLLLLDAKVKAGQLQRAQAESDLLAAAGFISQLSAQRSSGLISSLVGQLCLKKAFPVFADSLRGARGSPAYLKELSARLGTASGNQDSMKGAILEEMEKIKNTFRAEMENQLKTRPFWQRLLINKVMSKDSRLVIDERFNAAIDALSGAMTDAFSANDPASLTSYMQKAEQERQARKPSHSFVRGVALALTGGRAKDEWVAEVFTDLFMEIAIPDYSKIVPRYHAAVASLNVLRAAVAVKTYARAYRRPPESLDRLVPALLPAVPQDPFNKFAPLAYAASAGGRFVVYSFGPDGDDDKGAAALDQEAYTLDAAKSAGDIVYSE
ncbi:MAG TPA: hypothetical protein DCZ92_12815 [Elusimicrobia bacterium]|nr:MAG: hypothetical protein A2016_09440 [Elusimicrobia bacterium GWF2_62_30]HBA61670.1 hypothetical protein [Elusimicrobiota bacterium]